MSYTENRWILQDKKINIVGSGLRFFFHVKIEDNWQKGFFLLLFGGIIHPSIDRSKRIICATTTAKTFEEENKSKEERGKTTKNIPKPPRDI